MSAYEDEQTYGKEMIADIRRFAQPVVDQQVSQLRGELNQMKTQQNRERSMAMLDADPEIGAKWRSINDDNAFINWTKSVDPLSDRPRIHMLQQAFDMGDGQRAAQFFRAFDLSRRVPAQRRTSERLPGERAGSTPPLSYGERRIWTRASIARFYTDVRNGVYRDREDDRLRLEQDIIAAAAGQNRVADAPLQYHEMPV